MRPDSLSEQAHEAEQRRKANDALYEVLLANPDLLAQVRRHRWFTATVQRIDQENRHGRA